MIAFLRRKPQNEGMKQIPLTQGKVALVDDGDYLWLSKHRWHARRLKKKHTELWYAARGVRKGGRKTIMMHAQILGVKGGDHADHDGLNNQRYNLRPAPGSLNQANSRRINETGFRGVARLRNAFKARIQLNRKAKYLGQFPTAEDAARAYDRAAKKQWGEFAVLNFPR